MQLDYKGRPFPTWLKIEMSVLQLIALGNPEESVKGVKAAYHDFISGTQTEVDGIASIIYASLSRTLEESADLTEKKRQGGKNKSGTGQESSKSPSRVFEESLTQKQKQTDKEQSNNDIERTTTEDSASPSFDSLKRAYDEGRIKYPNDYDDLRLVYDDLSGKGWKVNNEAVANMGAYLRSFEKFPERLEALRRKDRTADAGRTPKEKPTGFNYANQRNYSQEDYTKIERALLNRSFKGGENR